MRRNAIAAVVLAGLMVATTLGVWTPPPPVGAQAADVYINVIGGGSKKLNIAVPDFTVAAGSDTAGLARLLASVTGNDLTLSGYFSVVAGTGSIPANNPDALKTTWSAFAAAGAHAGVHGLLTVRGPDRLEAEMRLYDLTSPQHRLIATKKFEAAAPQGTPLSLDWRRRLAHKIADEIVLQFTGEPGIADTKMAYVVGPAGAKELSIADYDGVGPIPVTRNGSINLSPVWSPDARSIAFTSFMNGYPDLFRLFPFERRPVQTLAAFLGINSSPAWSPDGRFLALTLSKDGNPEIYMLTVATGALQRLTRHAAIDTEPAWSPTGEQIAFISDRGGRPAVFVMDRAGGNVRQLTSGGFHTQPRWSPKGDTIVFTQRQGTHNLWVISPSGTNARQLTSGQGDNQGAAWAPDGRHLAFQSNRTGRWQVFFLLVDDLTTTQVTQGPAEATSPSWSPRLP